MPALTAMEAAKLDTRTSGTTKIQAGIRTQRVLADKGSKNK